MWSPKRNDTGSDGRGTLLSIGFTLGSFFAFFSSTHPLIHDDLPSDLGSRLTRFIGVVYLASITLGWLAGLISAVRREFRFRPGPLKTVRQFYAVVFLVNLTMMVPAALLLRHWYSRR